MKTRIIRIGNSQGVRIPKPFLEQTGLENEVEIKVEKNHIVIGPVEDPRQGWEEAFQEMAKQGDDLLLDGVTSTDKGRDTTGGMHGQYR